MTVKTKTLGCRLNHYESDILKQRAEKNNMKDTFIINTCAVTAEAERKSRQMVYRISRAHPNKTILVTGCAAKLRPEQFSNIENVQIIEKDINTEHFVPKFEDKTKAFLEIQNGCYHNCSYCTITIARGKSKSIEPEYILQDVQSLIERNVQEIVLTGVNIADYGLDLFHTRALGSLVKRILELNPKRLRLSSLDPDIRDDKLIQLINNDDRICPYIHLSLQSGNDHILKSMRRRHTRQDVIDLINRFDRKITFSADVIVGFPGETEEYFQDTYHLLENYFDMAHIFPFSPRPGTEAAEMIDDVQDKKQRVRLLRSLMMQKKKNKFDSLLGKKLNILIEDKNFGYSEEYFLAYVENGQKGTIQTILVTDYTDNYLICSANYSENSL